MTTAAPLTCGFAFEAAMMFALPTATPVTTPLLSTFATVVSEDDHVTVRSVVDAGASTDATKVTLARTVTVSDAGEIVTERTVVSGPPPTTTGTFSLQAVTPAVATIVQKRPKRIIKHTT